MSTPTSTIDTYLLKGTGTTPTWSILLPIKEFPDLGGTPESIDVTTLSDKMRHYVPGVQDNDAFEFTCNYDPTDFSTVQALDGAETQFAVAFGKTVSGSGGSSTTTVGGNGIFKFKGFASVFANGGGVNDPRDMTVSIMPSTDIDFSTTGVTVS